MYLFFGRNAFQYTVFLAPFFFLENETFTSPLILEFLITVDTEMSQSIS